MISRSEVNWVKWSRLTDEATCVGFTGLIAF